MATVVITGSSKGLGFALSRLFLENGWNVVINGTKEQRLEDAVQKLKTQVPEGKVLAVKGNVTLLEEMENLGKAALESFGSLDVWINNAGVNQPMKPIWELTEDSIKALLDIDLLGTINGSKAAMNLMKEQHHGAIYNVEGMGSNDSIIKGLGLYGTTKRAVTYFTRTLAKEAQETGVIVGRLSPGIMLTDFTDNALGGKEKIALPEKTIQFYRMVGDKPEDVAAFLVKGILHNQKNDAQLVWLTSRKVFWRMLTAKFTKRNQNWS